MRESAAHLRYPLESPAEGTPWIEPWPRNPECDFAAQGQWSLAWLITFFGFLSPLFPSSAGRALPSKINVA